MRKLRIRHWLWTLLPALLALGAAPAAAETPRIDWSEAPEHVGQRVEVEGAIVATKKLTNICFLNFSKNFKQDLTAVIFSSDFGKFDSSPEMLYDGKKVRITGEISEYKGGPQIKVSDPSQIEILEGGEGAAPLPEGGVISWRDAPDYLGQEVTVEGKIVASKQLENICFLNFSQDFRAHLTAVIFGSDFDKFAGNPAQTYRGKRVQIKGRISQHQGTPQIEVKRPEQIRILEEGEGEIAVEEKDLPVVSWDRADEHYGEVVVVEGKIVKTHQTEKVCFLNFHNNFTRYLTAVIFPDNFGAFPEGRPADQLLGKQVRITGLVTERDGKPNMVIESPNDIEIVGE